VTSRGWLKAVARVAARIAQPGEPGGSRARAAACADAHRGRHAHARHRALVTAAGYPHVQPLRLRREAASEASGAVDEVPLSRYVLTLRKTLKTCVAIVGGTTGALLRGQEKLRESKTMAQT
jgi:hypothetical protein